MAQAIVTLHRRPRPLGMRCGTRDTHNHDQFRPVRRTGKSKRIYRDGAVRWTPITGASTTGRLFSPPHKYQDGTEHGHAASFGPGFNDRNHLLDPTGKSESTVGRGSRRTTWRTPCKGSERRKSDRGCATCTLFGMRRVQVLWSAHLPRATARLIYGGCEQYKVVTIQAQLC